MTTKTVRTPAVDRDVNAVGRFRQLATPVATVTLTSGLRPTVRPLSSIVLWGALFSVSWDRLATFEVGGFNVKLSVLLFALSLALTAVDALRLKLETPRSRSVLPIALAIAFVVGLTGLHAANVRSAETQLVTVFLGALIPFGVTLWNARLFGNLDQALTAFIRGGWFAAVFGLYQLGAFYTGLPQLVSYEALGGGLGRISSFSYEAAYFGYFLVLVLGALYARARLRGETLNRGQVAFFVAVLLLANTRAVFFTLPLLFILIYARRPPAVARDQMLPFVAVGAFLAIIVALTRPNLVQSVGARIQSIFNLQEQASNAPRLQLYELALRVLHDHWAVGIGAGNLIEYAGRYGSVVPAGQTSNSFVVNNAWLQALLDGGVVLLVLEILFVAVALATLFRRVRPVSRSLMAGWLATFLVASLLTSTFFTTDFWIVLALATAASDLLPAAIANTGNRHAIGRAAGEATSSTVRGS